MTGPIRDEIEHLMRSIEEKTAGPDNPLDLEFLKVLKAVEEGIPFSLTCYSCDAGVDVDSPAEAVFQGWHYLQRDNGPSWNFLGTCPECYRREYLEEP